MGDGLGDREEHQPDAHAGAEHHRDPGHGAELGPVVVLSQAHATKAAEGQDAGKDKEGRRGQHEQPAEGRDDPAQDVVGDRRDTVRVEHPPEYESGRDGRGDAEDPRVDPALCEGLEEFSTPYLPPG